MHFSLGIYLRLEKCALLQMCYILLLTLVGILYYKIKDNKKYCAKHLSKVFTMLRRTKHDNIPTYGAEGNMGLI